MLELILKHLDAGWLDVVLAHGHTHLPLRASYLGDAPAELARASIALLEGSEAASCVWLYEPGAYHWRFHCTGQPVAVQILDDPEGLSIHRRRSAWSPLYQFDCGLVAWARAVHALLASLQDSYGEDYERRWVHYSYPWVEASRLSELMLSHASHTSAEC